MLFTCLLITLTLQSSLRLKDNDNCDYWINDYNTLYNTSLDLYQSCTNELDNCINLYEAEVEVGEIYLKSLQQSEDSTQDLTSTINYTNYMRLAKENIQLETSLLNERKKCEICENIFCLRNVTLHIEPSTVEYGHSSTLLCTYDLEGDTLYSVKWYRGNNEFYRYAPEDNPVVKFFPRPEITVDLSKSNSAQVVLKDIEFNLAGNFACEVTTDSPNIHTRIDFKSMAVVQLPEHPPEISVGREPLDYGDILRANCSSYPSRPPADLEFILNNITVNQSEPSVLRLSNVRSWSDLQLKLKLSVMHFNEGRLILQCVATIPPIYREVAELELGSVRHPLPARISAPSNTGTRYSADIKHAIQLSAYCVVLAFFVSQACY